VKGKQKIIWLSNNLEQKTKWKISKRLNIYYLARRHLGLVFWCEGFFFLSITFFSLALV
jgi:hypothetical protein